MKRSSAHEDDSGREKATRRQEPVSCQFCRKKKLKCDRGAPCSNCKARKLECSSAGNGAGESSRSSLETSHPASSQNIDELNNRIEKLENLLIAKSTDSKTVCINTRQNEAGAKDETRGDQELSKTLSFLETDAFEHAATATEEQLALDTKVCENFGTFIFSFTRPRNAPTFTLHLPSMLPTRAQGQTLLDYYVDHVNWIYQIIHVPTVQTILDTMYTRIEQNQVPEYHHIAIIATIFALSAYFSSPQSNLYINYVEAKRLAYRWLSVAQEALPASNCLSAPTIESLQSLVLISQHIMPNIGAIATLRTLATTSIHIARALGLHKIDSPANKARRQNTEVDWVTIEVKRRIWWHLASSDWLLSFMSGPQCGTYMISHKQMTVDYPTNVDDSDINPTGIYARPPDEQTDMTYSIFRNRFASVFREMVDTAWEAGLDMDELPFEVVLEFDEKLNTLIADFDKSFEGVKDDYPTRNSTESTERQAKFTNRRTMTRNMAHFGVHTRISRLHRPYLVRGARDPRYAYSRMVCLRSARTVIELGKNMTTQIQNLAAIKIWSINHHVFVSTVILVMDYCFNRDEPRAKERKEEILDCFRILEGYKGDSTIASRGLFKLRSMLSDNKVAGDVFSEEEAAPILGNKTRNIPVSEFSPLPFGFINDSMEDRNEMLIAAGGGLNQGMPAQWQWDLGFLDYDVDYSQFEALFHNIDRNREAF